MIPKDQIDGWKERAERAKAERDAAQEMYLPCKAQLEAVRELREELRREANHLDAQGRKGRGKAAAADCGHADGLREAMAGLDVILNQEEER